MRFIAGAALLCAIGFGISVSGGETTGFDAKPGTPGANPKVFRSGFADGIYRVETIKPNRYCTLELPVDFAFRPDLLLEFEYRNLVAPEVTLNANAVALVDQAKNTTYFPLPVSGEWRKARIHLGTQRYVKTQMRLVSGTRIAGLNIYSRNAVPEPVTAALEVRNLRFSIDPAYDPAMGLRVSYSSMPVFDWETRPGGKYRFEYSRDPAFPGGKTQAVPLTEPFWVPEKPLAPGIWHYRIADGVSGEIFFGDALVVPEKSQDWRMPPFDFAAFAARPRPRLKVLAQYCYPDADVIVKQAEAALDYPIAPNPEPYREGADPEITAWIEWYNKVGNGVITATGRRMAAVGQAALLTARADLKAKAKEWALEVGRNWDPESGTHARKHDLAVGNLMLGMAFCFDAAYDLMTPEEREIVASGIRRRGQQYWEWLHPFRGEEANNHPWAQGQAAVAAILSLPEEPQAEMRFRYLCDLFAYRFLPVLGFEGENNEGLAYWSYGTGLLVGFVDLAKCTVGVDLFQHPWLRQTARFPMYGAPNSGYALSFGDSGSPNHGLKGPIHRAFAGKLAAAGDREALWYAGMPEQNGVAARIPLDIPQSRFYPHLGIAFFNTFLPDARENVAVGFHSGRYYAGHQHPDQNGFVINAYGDKLAIDGGYSDYYSSPHFKAYSARTIAHNTVMVDGQGQAFTTFGADGVARGYFDSPGFGYIAGDASNPKIYNGAVTKFDRQLLFVKPDYVFVFDRLEAPKPSTFNFLIHSQTDQPIALGPDGRTFAIERPRARLDGTFLLPERLASKVTKAYEIGPNRVASTELEPNPEPEWLLTADNAAPVASTEFLTALEIRRSEKAGGEAKKWELLNSKDACVVKGSDCIVLFNRTPGQTVELGGIKTDAAVAAVRLGAGVMFSGGSKLTFEGKIWTSASGSFAALSHVTGKVHVFETEIEAPEFRQLSFEIPPAPMPRQIRLASEKFLTFAEIPAGKDRVEGILTPPGKSLLTISSAASLTVPTVTSTSVEYFRCPRLAYVFAPPAGSTVVEAENYRAANTTVTVLTRPAASGGKLIRGWNTEGLALEWEIPVEKAGKYQLCFRLACEFEPIRTRLSGTGFAVPVIADFGSTGGAGFKEKEYRYSRLPKVLDLPAGTARLKLEVLQGAPCWDCIVLLPAEK